MLVWGADLGWTLGAPQAALSLLSSAGRGGEKIRWRKTPGSR